MMEVGCPHRFGIVHQCPECGQPRHLSTSDSVTDRYLSEVEKGEREWPAAQPPAVTRPGTEAGRDMLRRHLTGNPNEWLQTPGDILQAILAIEAEARRDSAGLDVLRVHRALCRRQPGYAGHDNDPTPWPCEAFVAAFSGSEGDGDG